VSTCGAACLRIHSIGANSEFEVPSLQSGSVITVFPWLHANTTTILKRARPQYRLEDEKSMINASEVLRTVASAPPRLHSDNRIAWFPHNASSAQFEGTCA
jgi:methionine aminopeptidase